MTDLTQSVEIPRRVMTLFLIVDSSGSMQGAKIGAVNATIREIIPMLGEISMANSDAEIKIAVLDFSSGARWIYDNPKPASEFIWNDLQADNLTDFGEACLALSDKLSRKAFMNEVAGAFAPVLILLSDGEPTDNWESGLRKLKENKWYQAAIKIAIAIGDDANMDVLKEFTGNIESVILVRKLDALKKIIRTVSVTASMIGSQSSTAGNKTKQEAVIEQITNVVKETEGASSAAAPAPPMDADWD